MKKIIILFVLLFLMITFSSQSYGQNNSIKVEAQLLRTLIQKADTHIMLKEINGSIYVLDSQRNTIYPPGYKADANEVFYVFNVNNIRSKLSHNKLNKKALPEGNGEILILQTLDQPQCPPACP